MKNWELILTAVALAMDAFAVAICKGLATPKATWKHFAVVGLWFGGFQAIMPLIGYLLGSTFSAYITSVDHWIAFVLLGFIGANMIKESFEKGGECEECDCSLAPLGMFTMAVATSIDALAVGVSFALLPDVNIVLAVGSIGVITFLLSGVGVKIGKVFGARYKSWAELFGGVVLVLMGLKILLEHLGVLVI